jgi:hypothetical protein
MYRIEPSTEYNCNLNDFGNGISGQSNVSSRLPHNALHFTRFLQKMHENFSQRITM